MMKRWTIAAVAVLGLALSGCGGAPAPDAPGNPPTGSTPEIALPTVTPPMEPPQMTPAATEDPAAGAMDDGTDLLPTLAGASATVAKMAQEQLSQETGLAAETLRLVKMDEVVWNDSAIGCPKEGEMALQVLTPGFRFTFSDGGERYFVHTNQEGTNVVICDREVPLPANPDS